MAYLGKDLPKTFRDDIQIWWAQDSRCWIAESKATGMIGIDRDKPEFALFELIKEFIWRREKASLKETIMPERVCFITDGDGHWFLVPVSLREELQETLEDTNADMETLNQYEAYDPVFYSFNPVDMELMK